MPRTYEPIASTTLGASAASHEFTSIPGTFTDLVVIGTPIINVTQEPAIRFNSDSGNNYSRTYLRGNGTTASSGRGSNTSWLLPNANGIQFILYIMSYANTNVFKTSLAQDFDSTVVERSVHLWRSTSAITSIWIGGDRAGSWAAGSTFSLYGIKAA